jgi:phosphate transport system protein
MQTRHTLHVFDEDLNQLRALILQMGEAVRQEIEQGVDALLKGRSDVAAQVIANDRRTDELEASLHELTTKVLARQAAMAQDLREILAAERIGMHLERIGDYAKNAARRLAALQQPIPANIAAPLHWLKDRVLSMIDSVLEAYKDRDAERANIAWASDEELDRLYKNIFEQLLEEMAKAPTYVSDGSHLLLVAKGLERAGDHATDIAEAVYLMVMGKPIGGQRPKIDAIAPDPFPD